MGWHGALRIPNKQRKGPSNDSLRKYCEYFYRIDRFGREKGNTQSMSDHRSMIIVNGYRFAPKHKPHRKTTQTLA